MQYFPIHATALITLTTTTTTATHNGSNSNKITTLTVLGYHRLGSLSLNFRSTGSPILDEVMTNGSHEAKANPEKFCEGGRS
jgi:hypothetical protein